MSVQWELPPRTFDPVYKDGESPPRISEIHQAPNRPPQRLRRLGRIAAPSVIEGGAATIIGTTAANGNLTLGATLGSIFTGLELGRRWKAQKAKSPDVPVDNSQIDR